MLGESLLDVMLWLDSNYELVEEHVPETLRIKLAQLVTKVCCCGSGPFSAL